jgi:hypothetical protein
LVRGTRDHALLVLYHALDIRLYVSIRQHSCFPTALPLPTTA